MPVRTERTSDTSPNAPLPSAFSCRYISGLPTKAGCTLGLIGAAAEKGRLDGGAEGGLLCGREGRADLVRLDLDGGDGAVHRAAEQGGA